MEKTSLDLLNKHHKFKRSGGCNLFLEGARVLIGAVMDEDQVAEGDPVDLVVQELYAPVTKDEVSTAWMTAGKLPRIGPVRCLP